MAVIREIIVANREEFIKTPDQIPNLRETTIKTLTQTINKEYSTQLVIWFENSFIWFATDDGIYHQWASLLMQSVSQTNRWSILEVPKKISDQAQTKLINEVMHNADKAIYQLSDQVDARPRTKWDIEIYALNNFDDSDYDPFAIGVMPTVNFLRIKKYVKWLLSSMNESEVNNFLKRANQLRENQPEMQILKEIILPPDLI